MRSVSLVYYGLERFGSSMQLTAVNDPLNPESQFKRSVQDAPVADPQTQPRLVSSQSLEVEVRITRREPSKSVPHPL